MVIGRISGALSPGGEGAKPSAPIPDALTPDIGAAGLAVAAGQRGAYTEVERQRVTNALMKLLHLPGPKAAALRVQAEKLRDDGVALDGFAGAAAGLPPDDRDALVTMLWTLSRPGGASDAAYGHPVLDVLGVAIGMDADRLAALRPR